MYVTDYTTHFDEFMWRCDITKDPSVTLSRFKLGLRLKFQKQLTPQNVTDLEEAYRLVQELEHYLRPQAPHVFDLRQPDPQPGMSTSRSQVGNQSSRGPTSNFRPNPQLDKGKGIAQRTPQTFRPNQCCRCGGHGHFAV